MMKPLAVIKNRKLHLLWMILLCGRTGWSQTAGSVSDTTPAIPPIPGIRLLSDSLASLQPLSDSKSFTQGSAVRSPDSIPGHPNQLFPFRKIDNRAIQAGELLEFEIGWKFILAGNATMSVSDTVYNNRPCYFIETTARSSSAIDLFFKVRDRVETMVDREGLFPWKFKKHLREGKFRRDRETLFDPYNGQAFVKKDTVEIPPYVQDILSSFYFVRTLPLEVGKQYDVDNLSDKKIYPLRVLVHKKEQIRVPAGSFDCIVVEPVLRGEGLFNQKGRLTIWLTDDVLKIPVMMKSEVFIGTVDVKLTRLKIH
jgi:hypothetical protein